MRRGVKQFLYIADVKADIYGLGLHSFIRIYL